MPNRLALNDTLHFVIIAKWLGLGLIINTSNLCECMGVNGEALQLHSIYKKPYLLLQVM